ncbi:MAG: DUF3617 family protein [Burkholderiaceae bacterium]|nr:DUF3617 family protein [Burkholderiaceae bacterium]
MSRIVSTGVAALLLLAAQVQAQPLGRPGLWEVTAANPELDQARAQMMQQMEKMPPAQRAQVQAMMNSMGVGMSASGATRVCVSAEMAGESLPAALPEGCKGTSKVSGRTLSFEFSCQDGSNGRGEFSYPDDRSYTGWTDSTTRGRKMRIEHGGRWVSADCGALAPMRKPRW